MGINFPSKVIGPLHLLHLRSGLDEQTIESGWLLV